MNGPRRPIALFPALSLLLASLVLSACATRAPEIDEPEIPKLVKALPQSAPGPVRPMVPAPQGGGYYKDDGPHKLVPADLDTIPDAVPRVEMLYGPSLRPYRVLGQSFVPMTGMAPYRERGHASWYGRKFHGRLTAIGETYDMYEMTAAHPTLPLPTYARVTNVANGRSVVVRVNDRGPFLRGRLIDLSYAAAHRLGYINAGSAEVEVELLLHDEILALERTRERTEKPVYTASSPVERAPAPLVAESRKATETAEERAAYVQLGAFATPANAARLMVRVREELDIVTDQLHLLDEDGRYRLQIGPFASANEAHSIAGRIVMLLDLQTHIVMR